MQANSPYSGKHILVMGLGRFGGGVGVTRYLVQQGAQVTVTDLLSADQLQQPLADLADLEIEWVLGMHRIADFQQADWIVVNPAVDRRRNQYLQAAEAANVPMITEIGLLLSALDRDQVIGITGSAGKSTTTTMLGRILSQSDRIDHVFVGGNLGGSLLNQIDQIQPDSWVILELSSFMLETLDNWSPRIAAVTGLSENHLDRHGSMAEYIRAKQQLIRHQQSQDHAVLAASVADWQDQTLAQIHLVDQPYSGPLTVPGLHNRLNAAMAATIAQLPPLDVSTVEIERALADFAGLPHRMELVHQADDVRWFNDSKSTTPLATRLAIDSFPSNTVHLIAGGYDKGAQLDELAAYAAARCAGVYTIGHTGPTISTAAIAAGARAVVLDCHTLDRAVDAARSHALAGQVVLLSPGCASWDQFDNYEQRGQIFTKLATGT